MKYKVAIYCPDQHILYNLHTLDQKGVGGGVTSRIRMAHALAAAGHEVSAFVNCPKEETIEDVRYLHYSRAQSIQADIFIASTSGDGLDLSSLCDKEVTAGLSILMVHGTNAPSGMDCRAYDYIYALSNFVRELITKNWDNKTSRLFVSQRGVMDDYYRLPARKMSERDPFAMLYSGHPSKGLETALEILRLVREKDPRFSLHVYGGFQLWGGEEASIPTGPGIFYHGLTGQKDLAVQMQECRYSLILQEREEPFGMVAIESMRAGCIVLASPVGAYPEIVNNGHNGFLISGDPTQESTRLEAARLIWDLISDPQYADQIGRNAAAYPLDWSVIAQAWEEHWDWALKGAQSPPDQPGLEPCPACGGSRLTLADGLHCTICGQYTRNINP